MAPKEENMLKVLKIIDRAIVKVCEVFLIFSIVAMVGFAFWQVIARFLLKLPTAYAEEFARLAIVWCILIGGALAVRKNEHIRVDSLTRILPKPVQFILELFSHVLVIVFAVYITMYSYRYVQLTSQDFTTSLGYCRNIFFVPGIIFGGITILYTFVNIILLIYNQIHHTSVTIDNTERMNTDVA